MWCHGRSALAAESQPLLLQRLITKGLLSLICKVSYSLAPGAAAKEGRCEGSALEGDGHGDEPYTKCSKVELQLLNLGNILAYKVFYFMGLTIYTHFFRPLPCIAKHLAIRFPNHSPKKILFFPFVIFSDASGLPAPHGTAEKKEFAAFVGVVSTSSHSEMILTSRVSTVIYF